MKNLILILAGAFALNVWAAGDLTQEMDALGANKDLMKKAKAIDPDNKVRVVQKREVDRHMRLEVGLNYGMTATGNDPYVNTTQLGGQLDFHLTPRWSFGARYTNYNNSLSAEGKSALDSFARDPNQRIPAYGWAKDSYLIVGDWYPIYGKINLFDAAVAQFDIYIVGGGGQINLANGSSPLYTAGGGVGFWLAQHVSSRLEARWQGFNERLNTGDTRNMNETVVTMSVGFLL